MMGLASTTEIVGRTTDGPRAASLECSIRYLTKYSQGQHLKVTALCCVVIGKPCGVCRARAKFPHLRFEVQDAFDIPALKALSPSGSFDKICVDIGGIAELHTVMLLLGLYFRAFRQSVLIVKSKYLKTLLGNVQVFVPPEQRRLQQQGAHVHKQPGSQVQEAASDQAAAELTPQTGIQQLCQQGHSVQSTEECNGTSS